MGNTAERDSRRLETARNAKRALELREQHHTFEYIANELGLFDKSAARKLVYRAIQALPRKAAEKERDRLCAKGDEQERRMLERLERLDNLLEVKRRSPEQQIAAIRAACDAERTLTKIYERKAKLLGADKQPFEFTADTPLDAVAPHDAILGRLARIAAELGTAASHSEPQREGGT